MEKFKGTKGKWQLTTSALECDHNSEVATIWGDNFYGEGAYLIAHIDNSPGIEKGIANAQLIAAAPELLNACKEALKYVSCEEPAHYILTEAIEKAIGKEAQP